MSRTVTISDDLAALVEARRQEAGLDTMDAAVEALNEDALIPLRLLHGARRITRSLLQE
jgi:hypothetical protein